MTAALSLRNLHVAYDQVAVVLNFGKVLTTGTIDEIRRNPDVVSAYLGTTASAA
jgi:ABC-type branched-subunit amino acid transport system ATPase component